MRASKSAQALLAGAPYTAMGSALYAEYLDTSNRAQLMQKRTIAVEKQEALLDAFLSTCHWHNVYFLWRPNLLDEADNHLVELAVASQADAIVTQNTRDFKNSQLKFPRIQLLTPKQLLGAKP